MRSIHFTEEHETFRREVRRFVENEIAPHADAWEAARRIPREVFARMGDLGFLGICLPERYGGSGADTFFAVAFLEELPRSRMGGFCAAVSVQQFMATQHIVRSGTEELKQDYLVPSIRGRKVGALAITEPDTGSDVASIRTAAVRVGNEYVVRGAKTFITNGAEGDFYTLAVRTGPGRGASGLSLLVVDAGLPGVKVSTRLEKIGWHSSDTAELAFEDVRVPASRLIGGEGSGFYQIMEAFPLERLAAAAIAVGSADVALEVTLDHMARRAAFGKPLARFQALRHRLADMATELEAVRHLTYHAAWLHDRGEPAVRESAMAKLMATELGKRVADECVQFFGGYGYMEEYPVARLFRDARGATITAGTSEIMREIIARFVVDGRETEPVSEGEGSGPPEPEPAREPTDTAPPTSGPPPIEDVMRALPRRLRPDHARGWNAIFHFVLSGADHPDWTVRIENGACRVDEGLADEPDCVVRMKEKTYLGIADGSVNPQAAFLTGRIKVSSLSEMMRFVKAFKMSGGS